MLLLAKLIKKKTCFIPGKIPNLGICRYYKAGISTIFKREKSDLIVGYYDAMKVRFDGKNFFFGLLRRVKQKKLLLVDY